MGTYSEAAATIDLFVEALYAWFLEKLSRQARVRMFLCSSSVKRGVSYLLHSFTATAPIHLSARNPRVVYPRLRLCSRHFADKRL